MDILEIIKNDDIKSYKDLIKNNGKKILYIPTYPDKLIPMINNTSGIDQLSTSIIYGSEKITSYLLKNFSLKSPYIYDYYEAKYKIIIINSIIYKNDIELLEKVIDSELITTYDINKSDILYFTINHKNIDMFEYLIDKDYINYSHILEQIIGNIIIHIDDMNKFKRAIDKLSNSKPLDITKFDDNVYLYISKDKYDYIIDKIDKSKLIEWNKNIISNCENSLCNYILDSYIIPSINKTYTLSLIYINSFNKKNMSTYNFISFIDKLNENTDMRNYYFNSLEYISKYCDIIDNLYMREDIHISEIKKLVIKLMSYMDNTSKGILLEKFFDKEYLINPSRFKSIANTMLENGAIIDNIDLSNRSSGTIISKIELLSRYIYQYENKNSIIDFIEKNPYYILDDNLNLNRQINSNFIISMIVGEHTINIDEVESILSNEKSRIKLFKKLDKLDNHIQLYFYNYVINNRKDMYIYLKDRIEKLLNNSNKNFSDKIKFEILKSIKNDVKLYLTNDKDMFKIINTGINYLKLIKNIKDIEKKDIEKDSISFS